MKIYDLLLLIQEMDRITNAAVKKNVSQTK